MIYGSLYTESMENKHDGPIHRYGTSIFVAWLIKYFGGCKIWLDSVGQVFFLHRKHDFVIFVAFLVFSITA